MGIKDYFTDRERERYFIQKIRQDLAMPYHPTILARLKENLSSLKGIVSNEKIEQLQSEIRDYSGGIE